MSQFWHAHWAEDSYKPARLGNWQVPNWHPKFPCRHCTTTTFLADSSGRLLADLPRPKRSPWGNFKGTWELPLKIDRKMARLLSAPPKYKIAAWEAHKKYRQGPCEKEKEDPKKKPIKAADKKYGAKKKSPRVEKKYTEIKQPVVASGAIPRKKLKTAAPRKVEKISSPKKNIENVGQKELVEDDKMLAQNQRDDQLDQLQNFNPIAQEQYIEKLYPQEIKEPEKLSCLCVNKNPIRSPVHFAHKVIRKNICTVNERLRV